MSGILPIRPPTITQIAATQSSQGTALLFALCNDGSLWMLGDPFHHGAMEWTEVSPPPVSLRDAPPSAGSNSPLPSVMAP